MTAALTGTSTGKPGEKRQQQQEEVEEEEENGGCLYSLQVATIFLILIASRATLLWHFHAPLNFGAVCRSVLEKKKKKLCGTGQRYDSNVRHITQDIIPYKYYTSSCRLSLARVDSLFGLSSE